MKCGDARGMRDAIASGLYNASAPFMSLDVGIAQFPVAYDDTGGTVAVSAERHCCEVCRSYLGCHQGWITSNQAPVGALGTCALHAMGPFPTATASATARLPPSPREGASPARRMREAVLLLRSDARKLRTLTRCHVGYVRWLQTQLLEEADFELLVDVTALTTRASARGRRRRHTERVARTLRRVLGVDAFTYSVEDLHDAFAAVRHWPSPEARQHSRAQLADDAVRAWWRNVVRRHRPALGPNVRMRLTSYLVHEPSLVLWARRRRSTGLPLPPHVWVLEDDTIFMGSLPAFLRSQRMNAGLPPAVAPREADLVTVFVNLEPSAARGRMAHTWKVNRAFVAAYSNRRVHHWEHVVRYSVALIDRLDALLSIHGAAAHGEMFASTVCLAEPWCAVHDLQLDGVIAPQSALYGLSTSVLATADLRELQALYDERRATHSAPGVWLHAVKTIATHWLSPRTTRPAALARRTPRALLSSTYSLIGVAKRARRGWQRQCWC